MSTNDDAAGPRVPPEDSEKPERAPAAQRALAEAEARREANRTARPAPPEEGGRGGLDPVRYDDWEIAGRAVDF